MGKRFTLQSLLWNGTKLWQFVFFPLYMIVGPRISGVPETQLDATLRV
jgi:hypothetical protein